MIDEAEYLALMHGLKMAWNLGAMKIIVETDSLKAFNGVTGRQEVESSHGNVVSGCQAWLKRDWTATINQIFREGNRAADEKARLALRLDPKKKKVNKLLSIYFHYVFF